MLKRWIVGKNVSSVALTEQGKCALDSEMSATFSCNFYEWLVLKLNENFYSNEDGYT